MADEILPIQPVERPILCNPYVEPTDHWVYDGETGAASHGGTRRPAGYWYKTQRTGAAQQRLFTEEHRDDLPLVNLLRDDVRRWRDSGYRGATTVTKELLRHWAREDRERRLFFCQREAVETIIYLAEIRMPGKSSSTGFQKFALTEADLRHLLAGCPNLTVKERSQVLRPESPDNHYEACDIVPVKYRPLLQLGKVLVTNWHGFVPESEHSENGKSYAVVDKGPETFCGAETAKPQRRPIERKDEPTE